MILIRYRVDDFKKYCPDYNNVVSYDAYNSIYWSTLFSLKDSNHNVTEVEFNEDDYLLWIKNEGMQNSFLAQQCWVGNIHQGGNAKKIKNCIVCNNVFKGRADAKFCSSICRSKNYRAVKRVARAKQKKQETIMIAKTLDLDFTDEDVINRINRLQSFMRLQVLSLSKNNSHYDYSKKHYRRMLGL